MFMPLLGYGKDVVKKKIKSCKYITEVFPQGEVKTQNWDKLTEP